MAYWCRPFSIRTGLRPIAELDEAGAVISRFVFATGIITPDYMVKGGTAYRIISDQLGSPRVVIDVATGQVVQRMDHDEFGRVTLDTNPGFQPFGFGGGLDDRQTGLVHFGAREYDPEIGRWTVKDRQNFAGGDGTFYAYAGKRSGQQHRPCRAVLLLSLRLCSATRPVRRHWSLRRIAGPHAQRAFENVRRAAASAPKSHSTPARSPSLVWVPICKCGSRHRAHSSTRRPTQRPP